MSTVSTIKSTRVVRGRLGPVRKVFHVRLLIGQIHSAADAVDARPGDRAEGVHLTPPAQQAEKGENDRLLEVHDGSFRDLDGGCRLSVRSRSMRKVLCAPPPVTSDLRRGNGRSSCPPLSMSRYAPP